MDSDCTIVYVWYTPSLLDRLCKQNIVIFYMFKDSFCLSEAPFISSSYNLGYYFAAQILALSKRCVRVSK